MPQAINATTPAHVGTSFRRCQDKTGKCMLDPGVIRQQYIGGKFKGPGEWANTIASPLQIECNKAFSAK